ncbi:tail length tape measure protein [Arthrobacter phage Hestia]|uniref:Lysin A n=1 Tax=Arthrobacter phage Hestia TaxID=2419609 RepID=A0A3G3M3C4_9CAUD|nr:tail length tape measure protein [Arthrobacter phage Hestia]AYR00905.1 lysin A [Arthrobacter phage Hestia]
MRPVSAEFEISQNFAGMPTAGVVGNIYASQDTVEYYVGKYGNYQPFGHAGCDIACPAGTPVYAMSSGTVLWADWGTNLPGDDSGAGWASRWYLYKGFPGIVTVIQHQWGIGVYAHLSSNDAAPAGTRVREGQLIGYSGNTGGVAPHLHVEALINLSYVTGGGLIYGRTNPVPFFGNTTPGKIQAESTTTLEGFLMALTAKQQTDFYNRVMRYLDAPVSAVPKKVWGIPILRGGKKISALQELADAKTLIIKQQATIDALSSAVKAQQAPTQDVTK